VFEQPRSIARDTEHLLTMFKITLLHGISMFTYIYQDNVSLHNFGTILPTFFFFFREMQDLLHGHNTPSHEGGAHCVEPTLM
jgi:hypothetical protein